MNLFLLIQLACAELNFFNEYYGFKWREHNLNWSWHYESDKLVMDLVRYCGQAISGNLESYPFIALEPDSPIGKSSLTIEL